MIRSQLKAYLDQCFDEGVSEGLWSEGAAGKFTVELPKHEGQGDFSTNMALVMAGIEKKNPRELAKKL
jgi:arginyl-tRNA synthetase